MSISRTVVISCACRGDRLGMGIPKALLLVEGKSLIRRQLELLERAEDIRVVVGYQAEAVIREAEQYRKDITFVYNNEYCTTGAGASVCLAARAAREYLLAIDGDLLIHPKDMERILACETEFVGGTTPDSEDVWYLDTQRQSESEWVTGFTKEQGSYEWTGVTQILTEKIADTTGHVYQILEPNLPLKLLEIRTREIDTMKDYQRAVEWVKNGYL